ncbi:MAG: DNA polymerase I [Candidatus Omnitrophica bacterium]|nr:DNA polymerase I [Candidatus Omnitrophota bacterium]
MSRIFLLDATAFCYRAFYAFSGLSTSFGQPTNAVYGFINILNKILNDHKPEFIAACFDVSKETFRQKKFAEYKIQRPPMPDGLSTQIPYIRKVVSAYGIPIREKEGYEADDIIAVLAKTAKKKGMQVTIISLDKDMLQLVDEDVSVFNPYKDDGITYTPEKVRELFGVPACRITDMLALMGDSSDNIPGVPGIGGKTAEKLIGRFGSLDNLLAGLDQVKEEKIRSTIRGNLEIIQLNRELVSLCTDIGLEFDVDELRPLPADTRELFHLFKHLEFRKLLEKLDITEDAVRGEEVKDIADDDIPGVCGGASELIVNLDGEGNIFIGAGDKIFCLREPGPRLARFMAGSSVKKSGHDLKKTGRILSSRGITLKGLGFDTMIAGYLLNPSKGRYGLHDLAWDYLGKSYKPEAGEGAPGIFLSGALRPVLEKELRDKDLFKLFSDIEMPLVAVLADMESNGIRFDLELLGLLSADLEKRLQELIKNIYELSGGEFNINSPKQLGEVLFGRLKLPVVKKGKTGPSTDEEVLRNLASKHSLPALLLEYRQLSKLKSTYIDPLPGLADKNTGKVHSSFNQAVTETGRLSSSNPNLQNIPVKTDVGRNIRKAVIAFSDESLLVSCDYSQIELRILAHISKDENLVAAFRNNRDIHKATAALIYGVEESVVSDEMRDTAKRVNFGITYGLTPFGLSRDLEITPDEAQRIIDAYFVRYPGVKGYIQAQIKKAEKNGFVTTILGRRRYIPEILSKNQNLRQFAQRQAVNTPVQGSASDLIKSAMIEIHKEFSAGKFRTKMILQIHDELLFDVPRAEMEGVVCLIREKMEHVLELDVPVRVDIKKGKNWLEMEDFHTKEGGQ